MGVPKFYRWISERYPCLSEVVKEFQLPEFDNLYLDMNGVIHTCSHPDDDNPHFRITEEKIFTDICHYIDFLFRMIKPRKVFFMAVDGVAPRAKMNQQRGRRFRSAREAEELIEKAKQAGETLPTEKRFDSNCITPGTPFMVRLQEHLKYFVVDKISNDPLWQEVSVYLSGHETPGEGEHKVMDYIRWSKSQSGHDGNTRHCLYGLDADLIMLGLTSHEPNFSLLREEVKFGSRRDKNKRPVTPEETTFHLLHLSLMRDYLAYEFSSLKGRLPFEWDLECLIDDWIMMGFLVGNDFIPHLPNFHIHHDALPLLWSAYKRVLPTLEGYINEGGYLNLPRLEKYFVELSKHDEKEFESAFSNLKYLESKLGGKSINESAGRTSSLNKSKSVKLKKPRFAAEESGFLNVDDMDDEEKENEELLGVGSSSDDADDIDNTMADEFTLYKKDYYKNKLCLPTVGPEQLQELSEGYVRAIQWILLYYFEGVPSWSWYYPHHYSPYISDIRGFKDMKMELDLSSPFLPFQQLMAVLPAASRELLPEALQPLMTEPNSPVIDFYPVDFQSDLNGKQQSWEAVVLIPFIDEERLLTAMRTKEQFMTKEEHARNVHGPHLLYNFTSANMGFYPTTLPGKFPDIHASRAKCTMIEKAYFRIESRKLKKGLGSNVDLNVYFPGFPSLRHIPHTHKLKNVGVKVFQQNSRNSSMLLTVNSKPDVRLEELADEVLGKTIYVGWPHLHEARVTALANESFRIELLVEPGKNNAAISFNRKKLSETDSSNVARDATAIKDRHKDRYAIDVGNTEILVYASTMTGRTYTYGHSGTITLDKQFASQPVPFVHQLTTKELNVKESGHTTFKTLEEVFPKDSTIFMLGTPHYGAQGKVLEVLNDSARVRIALEVTVEPNLQQLGLLHTKDRYFSAVQAGHMIGTNSHIISRITGSVFVEKASRNPGQHGGKVNIGLNLKFTKREEEVPGYTRKEEHGWTYSRKCVDVVSQYINKFSTLWQRVSSSRSNSDMYTVEELFPEGSPYKLTEVVEFIDNLPSSKAPKMKFGCEILDDEQVARIENMTENLLKKPVIVKMKIKPRLLFRPLSALGSIVPDPNTDFLLYDRIIVVKAGYSVPFGKRGTITGIPMEEGSILSPHSVYDVVFDELFAGGITLRCSPNKGYRVPGSAMLNITYGEFRKDRPVSERPTSGIWNRGRSSKPGINGGSLEFGKFSSGSGQAVQWDSKRQPLFGQIFSGNGNSGRNQGNLKPEFVTPRIQAPQPVLASKPNMKTESVDFNTVWKTLQNQKVLKSNDFPRLDSSMDKSKVIQSMSQSPSSVKSTSSSSVDQPIKILSKPQSNEPASVPSSKTSTIPLVQSLFASPVKPGSGPLPGTAASNDNAEFMAMFNSLKIQTEELKQQKAKAELAANTQASASLPSSKETVLTVTDLEKTEEDKLETEAKEADNAIKQMLKIGLMTSKSNSASPPISPRSPSSSALPSGPPAAATQASASYGRQVSLQELFDQANRQLKTQPTEESKNSEVKVEKNDPVKELESFCSASGLAPPSYDFRHQTKQMAYIANVLIHGRGRYEGSFCIDKVEAAQSAASIALLCLRNKPNPPNMKTPFIPGAPRPGVIPPLFSQNSAFSPIRLPGQGPRVQLQQPDLMRPPPLLTPRHFTTQPPLLQTAPPPLLPLGQHVSPNPILNQLHHQLHQLASQFHIQQHKANQPFNITASNRQSQPMQPLPGQMPQPNASTSSTTTGNVPSSVNSSVGQPFIPLQVSRNQMTPKSKKEDYDKSSNSINSSTPEDIKKVVALSVESVDEGAVQHKVSGSSRNQNNDGSSQDFGFSTQPFSPNGHQKDEMNDATTVAFSATMSTPSTSPQTSENNKKEKLAMQKKKSRLAANFSKKNSDSESLSQTK